MKRKAEKSALGMLLGSLCVALVACVGAVGDHPADNPAPATTEQRLGVQSDSDDATDPEGAIEQSPVAESSSCTAKFCRACILAGGDCENEGVLGCFCI